MDSAPSQLNFVRPLELCDFMYLELQKMRKRNLEMEDLLSQSQFNHFHSQRSALIDLLAICFKRYFLAMGSAWSRWNFELPPELCDIMFLESQKLWDMEMKDLWSQLQPNDFPSHRSAWADLLAICNKGYMETMDSEIEEADSAPSQLNFERLLENFLYCELEKLRKRNLEIEEAEIEGPPPLLQFHHFHYEIVCLTDILATCKKLSRCVSDSEIEEADSAPSQFNFERLLELCDFMCWDLQKSRKWNLKIGNQWSKWQKLDWYTSDSKIEEADLAPSPFKLEPLQQLGNFLCLNPLTRRKQILEYRDMRLLSQFAHRLPWPSEEKKLYLFFYLQDSPVMYILYEIKVTKPFPPPPTEAAQDANKWDLSGLNLILQFETGMYPEGMCCVQLGSELYFLGGEFNLNQPNICIYEDLKKFKKERWDVLPRDVYIFYPNLYREYPFLLSKQNENMLLQGRPMNSGKASPQAFVADGMIYVIGSTFTNLDNERIAHFEVYDPVEGIWTILPNLPISNLNTRWVGNAVVGRKAVLVALQLGQKRLYCFDLDTRQWTNRVSIPDFLSGNFFSRKSEFIEDTLYGCYGNTVGAIAPLANNEDEDEDEEVNNEEEDQEEEEEEEVQQVERLLNNHRLHLVSAGMGTDTFFNIPGLLQSSSSLLHLENRYFCYVMVGTRLATHPILHRYRLRSRAHTVSIVIFQALIKETYTEKAIDARFFRAKSVYSKHYESFIPDSKGLFIKACYALGF